MCLMPRFPKTPFLLRLNLGVTHEGIVERGKIAWVAWVAQRVVGWLGVLVVRRLAEIHAVFKQRKSRGCG